MQRKPTSRRTRGPRTPDERATDAAQSTATLFEKLPSSYFADTYLKPIAALLRFETGTAYLDPGLRLRDVRAWDENERKLLRLVGMFERDCKFMPVREAVEVGVLLEALKRDLRAAKGRIAAAVDKGGDVA